MTRFQCRIPKERVRQALPISWFYFLVRICQQCMRSSPNKILRIPQYNLNCKAIKIWPKSVHVCKYCVLLVCVWRQNSKVGTFIRLYSLKVLKWQCQCKKSKLLSMDKEAKAGSSLKIAFCFVGYFDYPVQPDNLEKTVWRLTTACNILNREFEIVKEYNTPKKTAIFFSILVHIFAF